MGEPAGVGPELLLRAAQCRWPAQITALACPQLLQSLAKAMALPLKIVEHAEAPPSHQPGVLPVIPVTLDAKVQRGRLEPANAAATLSMLKRAGRLMLSGQYDALVTAPVHKKQLNNVDASFAGHTEFFAEQAGVEKVVMMLASAALRVALVTTHIPLARVAQTITTESLQATIGVIVNAVHSLIGRYPKIAVAGLNPHAGENGLLGDEEISIIAPTIASWQQQGYPIDGPFPADTLFTKTYREQYDLFLAMYHDQGLAVIKALSFGECTNVTLGLPYIRTSVDHGTALDIAAQLKASDASIKYAINYAIALVNQQLI